MNPLTLSIFILALETKTDFQNMSCMVLIFPHAFLPVSMQWVKEEEEGAAFWFLYSNTREQNLI